MKTIYMKRADWEKWDSALRSGKYQQCEGTLTNGEGFCCLGVLEQVLDGDVERDAGWEGCARKDREPFDIPSKPWLADHGITFLGKDPNAETPSTGGARNPYLPKLGTSAASANDDTDYDPAFGLRFNNNFIAIADAIADAVEFTD